ncbi:MAG TPA: tyrosine--tRNA ligase [Anaerolineae bacterium]|nr:tyrosine--tRNA ligase [Anaerolineae bacterium]
MPSIDEQVAVLMQGAEYGDETLKQNMAGELRQRLIESQREDRPLRVYCGYDPTKPDLHLGHTITMRKLRQFQDFGHDVTFLIGDYTTLIGDPSDKDKLRPTLSPAEIRSNAETYADQAFKILDRKKTRIRYNSEWLSRLTFGDVIKLASNFTIQQFMARENFALRLERGDPVYLHETLYGLMQGYDAVAQQTDVQVGGSEQLFNIIVAGRKLQEAMGQKPQIGILMDILPGTDGVVRMSKSQGNTIEIMAPPEDMYGKVMSLPDSAMPIFYKLVTRFTPAQIAEIEKGLRDGSLHPRDVKMQLAREIVSIFHDEAAAARAEEHFVTVFRQKELPPEMPGMKLEQPANIVDLIASARLASSKSEARRLIEQGGVRLDGVAVSDIALVVEPGKETVLQVGKRKYLRLLSK